MRRLRLKLTAEASSKSWVWFYTPTQQYFLVSQRSSCCWLSEQRDRTIFYFALSSQKKSKIIFYFFFFFGHSFLGRAIMKFTHQNQDQGVCFCRPLTSRASFIPTWRSSRSMGGSGGTPERCQALTHRLLRSLSAEEHTVPNLTLRPQWIRSAQTKGWTQKRWGCEADAGWFFWTWNTELPEI